MVNNQIRKWVQEIEDLTGERIGILESPAVDNAIVGMTIDNKLIYDKEKIIKELMKEKMTREQAVEFFHFNTLQFINAYIEEDQRPVILSIRTEAMINARKDNL